MRDALYITGLIAAMFLLALDFPADAARPHGGPRPQAPFASFAVLSPSVHAACLESAKTSWQVRSGSMGRPLIGSLDSGIPLLADSMMPRERTVFREPVDLDLPMGLEEIDVYSLLPETAGKDVPAFAVRPQKDDPSGGTGVNRPFARKEMLSPDGFKKLKEMMQ